MGRARRIAAAAALVAAVIGYAGAAHAQPPFGYQLPSTDFMWRWGRESSRQRLEDIHANGNEAGFRCELIAALSPATHYTTTEVRQIEQDLGTRMDFIYAATTLMNQLDATNQLDSATLTCARPKPTPSTEEEKAENEQRAKEKMQKEVERRRARQQKAND